MNRKIISQGGGGFTIYLPKKWVDKKKLKPGDQISINETGTALTIDSSVKEKRETSVEITEGNKKDLYHILTHLYRMGFDSIVIKSINESLLEKIKDTTIHVLLGFEVTEIDKDKCKIENMTEPTGDKYEVILRRIFLIIKETQRIVSADFKSNIFTSLKEIEDFRHQQDRYIIFCRRILKKERFETQNPLVDWELLTLLMHIEHAYFYLYSYAAKSKLTPNKKIIELLEALEEYFQFYYDAYYKKDIKLVHKIQTLKDEYQYGKCYEYLEQAKGEDAVIFSHIRELFRLIQLATSPIWSEHFEAML